MWLGTMDGIMDPSATLLDANSTPFGFVQKTVLRQVFRNVGRQDHMTGGVGSVQT